MSVTSIPVAAFRYTADGAQAIAETVRIRTAVEQLNESDLGDLTGAFLDFDFSVKGVAESAAGLVSAGSLLALIKQGADFVNEIGTAASRAGTTAESLSKLKFAAEESDVSFEALTSGIRKFQDGLSDAASGQGEFAETLKEIGLSARDLRGQELEAQLGVIADAFRSVGEQSDRVRISNDLFGRSSTELISLLGQGSAGIAELTQRAEDLGLALDNRATAAVDRGAKAIERLGKVSAGVFATVAQQIALLVTDSGDPILERIARIEELERRIRVGSKENNDTARARVKQFREELQTLQAEDRLRKSIENVEFSDVAPVAAKVAAPDGVLNRDELDAARKEAEEEANRRREFENLLIEERADIERGAAEAQKQLAREVSDNLEEEITRRNDMEAAARDQLFQQEIAAQENILAIRRQGTAAAQTLLTAYGGKFASVAKAILAIEKANAIIRTIIATKAAVMKTYEYYGGTPFGIAAAAFVALEGAAAVAAIAAQGKSSGGGGSVSGRSAGGVPSGSEPAFDPIGDANQPFVNQAPQTATQIIINGNLFGNRETIDMLIEGITEAVEKRDVVIISNRSRNAQEIMQR